MKKIIIILLIIAAFAFGYLMRGGGPQTQDHQHAESEAPKSELWTCSMHPQIQLPKAGQCPLCGMDLIPVSSGETSGDAGPRELNMSAKAMKLAALEVIPIERKEVTAKIRMVGKVDYDETRTSYITAWVPGRIDDLFVDYTGVEVNKGDPMVSLYSPDLLTAQEELLQAIVTADELQNSNIPIMRETASKTVKAAKEKLRLWGLTEKQIEEIETRGKTTDHVTIYTPISGVVIHKDGLEGMYVETGTKIYTIADLSQVWVKLDAYESDLIWIRNGQKVEFETEAYPGETFKGKVVFVDPFLDPKTRTAKVRVNVPNPYGKLRPEIFVRAEVHAVIKRERDVIKGVKSNQPPLVIPATAPLFTGKRAIVYVEVPDKKGTYEGREVLLGPRTGDFYIVRGGLSEGEQVVVNGNFKIDSAIQILAKPSMMSPEGGAPPSGHDHGTQPKKSTSEDKEEKLESFETPTLFKLQLDGVFSSYFMIHQALSQDKLKEAQDGAQKLLKSLDSVDMKLLEGPPHMAWMKEHKSITSSAQRIAGSKDIKSARSEFISISSALYRVAKQFGTSGTQPVLRFYCSMAADGKGAYWLQNKTGVENPYYGSAMFKCGEQVEIISTGPVEVPDSFNKQMNRVFLAYFDIHQALSHDDFKGSQSSAGELVKALAGVEMELLKGLLHEAWMKEQKVIETSAQKIAQSGNIEGARSAFIPLSDALYNVTKQFGTNGTYDMFRFHCSMAAGGKGAYWLQNKSGVENPYYGSAMFTCGEQIEAISSGFTKEHP
jgi:Cu(I)/Ag(I) efflux system membrane fusion protein